MITSKEVIFIKRLFLVLGNREKCELIEGSNLTDTERNIFMSRFVYGSTAKSMANSLNLSQDGYDRLQKKLCLKFYLWISIQPNFIDYQHLVDFVATRKFISAVKVV